LSLNSVQAQINKVDASGLGLNGVQQVAFASTLLMQTSTKLMQARRKSDKSITSVKARQVKKERSNSSKSRTFIASTSVASTLLMR
jgi:hypothetical protein